MPRLIRILHVRFQASTAISPSNSSGGETALVSELTCVPALFDFLPPPGDRIPVLIQKHPKKRPKKNSYFSRAKIYLKRQSQSAKGVRDLIPPTPACGCLSRGESHHSGCADDRCSHCVGRHSSYARTGHNSCSADWRDAMSHPMFWGSSRMYEAVSRNKYSGYNP